MAKTLECEWLISCAFYIDPIIGELPYFIVIFEIFRKLFNIDIWIKSLV